MDREGEARMKKHEITPKMVRMFSEACVWWDRQSEVTDTQLREKLDGVLNGERRTAERRVKDFGTVTLTKAAAEKAMKSEAWEGTSRAASGPLIDDAAVERAYAAHMATSGGPCAVYRAVTAALFASFPNAIDGRIMLKIERAQDPTDPDYTA